MSLKRKVAGHTDSLTIVIPHQLAELHDISPGTIMEFEPTEKGRFIMKALPKVCRAKKRGSNEIVTIQAKDGKCVAPKGFTLVD